MATNCDVASSSEESVVLPTYTEESSCSDDIVSTTLAMSHSSLGIFEPENEREYDGSPNVTKATSTDHETIHESNLIDEVASGDRPMESVVAASGRSLPAEEMLHERINQEEQGVAQTDDVWATEHQIPRTWHEHEEVLDEQRHEQAEEGQDQLDAEPDDQGMAGLRATEKHQCIICWESVGDLPDDIYVQLHCGYIYCRDCINAALEISIRCEANFPLHCACKRPLPIEEIYHLLAEKLLDRYFAVLLEWTSVHRTYCAKCHQYIDSKEFREDERYSTCTSCIEETCRECKASKSDHETGCPPDTDRQKLLQLSTSEGWKQCSSCGNLIEKNLGCDHMTCICGHDFCYICGYGPYDSHDCGVGNGNVDRDEDDWHDDRLDWQEYIFDEEGNPICEHTVFENSPYGGRCQGACGHVLPFYLNECSNCELRVCNHCVTARSFVPREQNDDTADRDVCSDTALDSEQGQNQVHDEGPQQSESATQDDAHTAESTDIVSDMAQISTLDETSNSVDALSSPFPSSV